MKTTKDRVLYGLVALCLIGVVVWVFVFSDTPESKDASAEKIAQAIKQVESEEPHRFSENPTEEEVYGNEYIKHIRTAVNSYLSGTNEGIDEYAVQKTTLDSGKKCGLDNFDKSYYKSKFIILSAGENDYGGVQADLFFIDKPDTLFWAWVYKLGGDGGYELRGFCESDAPIDTKSPEFKDFSKGMIKESKYSL